MRNKLGRAGSAQVISAALGDPSVVTSRGSTCLSTSLQGAGHSTLRMALAPSTGGLQRLRPLSAAVMGGFNSSPA